LQDGQVRRPAMRSWMIASDRRAHLREDLRLREVAREAVEEHRHVARRLRDHVLDHLRDERVGHEVAGLHVALGLDARRRALRHRTAQQVAGRDVLQVCVFGRQAARDRTLPRTRGPQQNDNVHVG